MPADSGIRMLFEQTKIKSVMRSPVFAVYENDKMSQVLVKFRDHNLTHLCVINRDNELVGLISRKYLYKAQSPRKSIGSDLAYSANVVLDGDSFYTKETLDSYILENIMRKDPYTLTPEDSLARAVCEMANKKLGCIPIIDAKRKIHGILTDLEVINYVARLLS